MLSILSIILPKVPFLVDVDEPPCFTFVAPSLQQGLAVLQMSSRATFNQP